MLRKHSGCFFPRTVRLCSVSHWDNPEDKIGAVKAAAPAVSLYPDTHHPSYSNVPECNPIELSCLTFPYICCFSFQKLLHPFSLFKCLKPTLLPLLFVSFATVVLKHSSSSPASWNCPSMCNPSDLYFLMKHIA